MHEGMAQHKTLRGHRDLFRGFTNGELSEVISDTWDVLADVNTLSDLGLASINELVGKTVDIPSERAIAQVMLETAVSVMGDLAVYEFELTHSLYGFAPRFLSGDPESINEDTQLLMFEMTSLDSNIHRHNEFHSIFI